MVHVSRIVTCYEDFCSRAPDIDNMFRFRLNQFVSVSKAPDKKTKADHAIRSTVCVAVRYMGMVS